MERSTSELLVYGLIIAGFLLFNFLVQQMARRGRAQQEAEPEAGPPAVEDEEELEDIWGRAPAVPPPEPVPVQSAPAPAAAPTRMRAGMAPHQFFRTRRDLRQAIVMMTVLGPCRALEPPEPR